MRPASLASAASFAPPPEWTLFRLKQGAGQMLYNRGMELQEIVTSIRERRFRITDHADEEIQADHLSFDEVFLSVLQGEIIEAYPTDKPYPSCLIFGRNFNGEPIHSVWAYNHETGWAVLVTVYRPDPARWIDWRERKKR